MKVAATEPPVIGRWPLGSWSAASGIPEPTLFRMLIRAGIRSTKRGFTPQEIFQAVNSEGQTAKLQEAVARAKFYELRNLQINGEMIPKALVRDAFGALRTVIREVILNSATMPIEEQETLLRAIAQVEVMEAPPSDNGSALKIGRRMKETGVKRPRRYGKRE
jgi:hypothetical protein